jgi:hypothetical protein
MTAALGHTPQRAVEEDVELLSDDLNLPERRDGLVEHQEDVSATVQVRRARANTRPTGMPRP